jgi:hypothetical protein
LGRNGSVTPCRPSPSILPLLASSSILCVTPRRNLTISTWLLRGA